MDKGDFLRRYWNTEALVNTLFCGVDTVYVCRRVAVSGGGGRWASPRLGVVMAHADGLHINTCSPGKGLPDGGAGATRTTHLAVSLVPTLPLITRCSGTWASPFTGPVRLTAEAEAKPDWWVHLQMSPTSTWRWPGHAPRCRFPPWPPETRPGS